ncbi:glycosyltransferase family 8 protein [Pseudohoeflea suaedae]|uniref:glycosyltransferase family 8 protein n=1 Tax=Pseudohoeflea suaedae TaxID=877384 RepID=UPI001304A3C8|nr:glycosyltransferase [Pseudohoeflea suaedae]
MKNAIFLITDARFAKITGAVGKRLARQWECDVHVFVEDENADLVDVPGGSDIRVHRNKIKASLPRNIPLYERWPHIVFLRCFATTLLKDYDRLLYLDADILCERADQSIWGIELADAGLGAVTDAATIDRAPLATGLPRAEWLSRIGVSSDRYFNAGVMLIDPARLDCEMVNRKLAHYYDDRHFAGIKSQDFFNHAFDGRWTELNPRWNYQPPFFELGLDGWIDPVFLHFCSSNKPWFFPDNPGASGSRLEHEKAFFEILEEAGISPHEVAASAQHKKSNAHYRTSKMLRARLRATLSRFGVRMGKERRARATWLAQRRKMIDYLNTAHRDGRFADALARSTHPPLTSDLKFDGRKLWLQHSPQMPDERPLAAN